MPSASKASRSSSPANGSSRPRRRGPPSTIVTSLPSRRKAWASSAPAAPPPSTSSFPGTLFASVASRFVHAIASARPSIGGRNGPVPVATMTARRASSRVVEPSRSTSTARSPASRPWPRTSVAPTPSSHFTCPSSFQLEVM